MADQYTWQNRRFEHGSNSNMPAIITLASKFITYTVDCGLTYTVALHIRLLLQFGDSPIHFGDSPMQFGGDPIQFGDSPIQFGDSPI